MRAAIAVVASLLVLAGECAARKAYACSADSCNSSPTCECASNSPPGGLKPSNVPQFIVLTNDDSVSSITYPVIRSITDQHKNPNGCPMPATWFVQTEFTDPKLVQQLYLDNHEIASHTITHPSYPNASEILGARTWLNQVAGVPLDKIKGFRAPFLLHDPAQRAILRDNGFTYDSSITDQFGPGLVSPNGSAKVWPFTMDAGIPLDCTIGTGSCGANEVEPGLWEFPLWSVQDVDGSVIASMDPQGDNFEIYQREFERNYNGNRCPLGMYLHAGLLMAFSQNQKGINDFLAWALQKPDVWVVTISEVLRWMKEPVPASQYALGCAKPTDLVGGIKYCSQNEPDGGCGQGTWDVSVCACACLYQNNTSSTGFCPGPDGSCSVQKLYDDTALKFYCPGQNYNSSVVASPSPADVTTTPFTFGFYITGATSNGILLNKAQSICDAVTQVALETGSQCEVSAVNDVTGDKQSGAKLFVAVTIQSTKPASAKLALQSAAQYGTLATALKAVGVTFDSVATDGTSAAAPSPSALAPAPTPQPSTSAAGSSGGGGSSSIGAIVGGVVGGLVTLAVAAVTIFLVLRHRKKKRTGLGSSAPSHGSSPKVVERHGSAIQVLASNVLAAHSTSFNGSPRSSLTPRHSSLARHSGDHTSGPV